MTTPLNPEAPADIDIAAAISGMAVVTESVLPEGALDMPADLIGSEGPWYALQLLDGRRRGWTKVRSDLGRHLRPAMVTPNPILAAFIEKQRAG